MTETEQHKIIMRKIIEIDEDLCTGCGQCVVDCAESALEVIDGKAKVVNEVFCDGLGACMEGCPTGALTIIEREAPEFSEEAVEKHLENLKETETHDHCATGEIGNIACNCAGSAAKTFDLSGIDAPVNSGNVSSQLRHWPVQMNLISPLAPYYKNADVLLAADCTAFSFGGFHSELLKGKSLAIACPKLDQGHESYIEKIRSLIDDAKINTLTVAMMEVPCCSGLLKLAQEAVKRASRKVPIKYIIISSQGELLKEEWL